MTNENNRISIWDSYPGSGKTLLAIQTMNESDSKTKYLFVTPYLDEITRIIKSCPRKYFREPNLRAGKGKKSTHLLQLIREGYNIACTHQLLRKMDEEHIELLRGKNYILIMDEVFQCVERYNIDNDDDKMEREIKEKITKNDIKTLIEKEHIRIGDDYKIYWNNNIQTLSKYDDIRELANREILYLVNESLPIWIFPIKVFEEGIFDKIIILTFKFQCQLQAYYFQYFNLCYTVFHVEENEVGEYHLEKTINDDYEKRWRSTIKEKIHVIKDEKFNRIGSFYIDKNKQLQIGALSSTWYRNHKQNLPELNHNLDNYFKHKADCKASTRLWTCFKKYQSKIKSRDVSKKHWLGCNARATNDYSHKTCLAYLINKYMDPFYQHFFRKKGIRLDINQYALSEMLQWIFRSAIRDNQEITIYIPSERMRNLLFDYLG